jgi:hypothetical protein
MSFRCHRRLRRLLGSREVDVRMEEDLLIEWRSSVIVQCRHMAYGVSEGCTIALCGHQMEGKSHCTNEGGPNRATESSRFAPNYLVGLVTYLITTTGYSLLPHQPIFTIIDAHFWTDNDYLQWLWSTACQHHSKLKSDFRDMTMLPTRLYMLGRTYITGSKCKINRLL